MKVRYFDENDYRELSQWWISHGHSPIQLSSLPHGVVVTDQDRKLAMSFLYTMNGCDMAQIAWTTSNPENGLKENYAAVDLAIDALLELAKKLEKKNVTCFSSSKGLTKILEKKGLKPNTAHMLSCGSF